MNTLKITELKPYAKNSKVHSDAQIEKVANSIKKFGFIQPIVVDKDNTIVIGHCRYEAAKLLGLEEVPTVSVDNLTPAEVRALRIADNKLNESTWDMGIVMKELHEINLSGIDVDLTGFDRDMFYSESDGSFSPNLSPERGDNAITKEDVDKSREELRTQFGKDVNTIEVICPQCAHEFHINA